MDDSKKYYVGFNLVKGIGAARLSNLIKVFGEVEKAWKAPINDLQEAGLSSKLAKSLEKIRSQVVLEEVMKRLERNNITILTWDDLEYPARIKEIELPPPVLFVRGCVAPEDDWAVAIVGTRRMTSYGRQVTTELAQILAVSGVTIVSGLARGVDVIAHQSALEAGGRTLAVLGSGVDQIYPPEHNRISEKIIQQGALLSDYPMGTPPDAANFPPRNRIISGLVRAVIVVEAGQSSGALITAAFAVEQGREVFAVPGGIYAPQSKGTNLLIQQGARLLLNAQEVLEVLNLTQVGEYKTARTVLPSDPTEATLYQILGYEPCHIDQIHLQSGMPIEKVSATLALMELKGFIRQVGGMQYVAVREPKENYG
jgi:DNA processing protein